jgi:hypothetical protein
VEEKIGLVKAELDDSTAKKQRCQNQQEEGKTKPVRGQ